MGCDIEGEKFSGVDNRCSQTANTSYEHGEYETHLIRKNSCQQASEGCHSHEGNRKKTHNPATLVIFHNGLK